MTKPLWILSVPRSGTHWVGGMLFKTGKFDREITKEIILRYILQNKDKNYCIKHLPKFTILMYEHFLRYKFTLEDKKIIKNTLPGIRFIKLVRNDIIARSVSLAMVRKKLIHIIQDKRQLMQYKKIKHNISDKELLHQFRFATSKLGSKYSWNDKFLEGENYIEVTYENLLKNIHEVKRMVEFAIEEQVTINYVKSLVENPLFLKLTHPEKICYIKD